MMEVKRIYNERCNEIRTDLEEVNLIDARIRLDNEFQLPKTKNHFKFCWRKVIREANLNKPTQLVTNKWQNILKKYKKLIKYQSNIDENTFATDWSSFKVLHRFLRNKAQIKPYLKSDCKTSAEESNTDASISIGDIDFDYQEPNEPETALAPENSFETNKITNHIAPDLTIVKNEMVIEPIPNQNAHTVHWNNMLDNFECNSPNKVVSNETTHFQQFSIRQMDRTPPIMSQPQQNDVNELQEDKPDYMIRPLNRTICSKRRTFRKPEYISPKVVVRDPSILTRFRSARIPEEDEDRTFMLSLIPSIKKLNDEQKLIVKTEFLKVLMQVSYPNSALSSRMTNFRINSSRDSGSSRPSYL